MGPGGSPLKRRVLYGERTERSEARSGPENFLKANRTVGSAPIVIRFASLLQNTPEMIGRSDESVASFSTMDARVTTSCR